MKCNYLVLFFCDGYNQNKWTLFGKNICCRYLLFNILYDFFEVTTKLN